MMTPAVRTDSGIYLMYYFGGNYEQASLEEYLDNNSATTATATASSSSSKSIKIQGMKMRIGVAVSQDGISFGRVECDDPTGACISPYDANDPNMKPVVAARGEEHHVLEEELYCAWPEVVSTAEDEEEEQGSSSNNAKNSNQKGAEETRFLMYYSTMKKTTKQKCIARAVSPDGFRWMKRGICLRPSTGEDHNDENDDSMLLDVDGCARCCVVRKAQYDPTTLKWKSLKGWQMYYEGVSNGKHRILLAESDDEVGRTWHKKGLVLNVGESKDAWDCAGVGSPHVLRYVQCTV
jgi:hypothetical protein